MMNYFETVQRESAALIDLAAQLEQQEAVIDGTIVSSFISPRQALKLVEISLFEIKGALSLREKALANAQEQAETERKDRIQKAEREQKLRVVALTLPAEWKPTVEDGRIRTNNGATLYIEDVYASSGRYSWRVGPKAGEKLIVSCNYEDKRFPRKKDGSFSMDKAIEFIRAENQAKAAREAREGKQVATLTAFRKIAQPFYEYTIYSPEHEWRPSPDFHLKARAVGDGRYAVSRTVTEYVDGTQLEAILEQEVGKVKKEQEA